MSPALGDSLRSWGLHLRAAFGLAPVAYRMGLGVFGLLAVWRILSLSALTDGQALVLVESWVPLLASLAAAAALWPEYRSGAVRGLVALPSPLPFRYLLGRAVVGSAAFLGTLTAALVLSTVVLLLVDRDALGRLPKLVPPLVPSTFFLVALSLAATVVSGRPWAALAACTGYVLLDAKLGVTGNPLLTLRGLTGFEAEQLHAELWPLGKAGILAAGVGLLLFARRACDGASLLDPRRPSRVLATLFLATCLVSVGELTILKGRLHRSGTLRRGGLTGAVAEQVACYAPIPVAYLFGPTFHALSAVPAGEEPQSDRLRATAIERIVDRWPDSRWLDGILLDLADSRSRTNGMEALHGYWDVAQRFPESPYAPAALARIADMERVNWSEQRDPNDSRERSSFVDLPVDLRIGTAVMLLEKYPQEQAVSAARVLEAFYPAGVSPDTMARAARLASEQCRPDFRARWVLIAARAAADAGRPQEAASLAETVRGSSRIQTETRELLDRLRAEP